MQVDYHGFDFNLINKFIISANYLNLPIISIGSGTGVLEKHLQTVNNQYKIICIDPDPQSCQHGPIDWTKGLRPDYATIKELLIANSDIKSNCVMLLCWPNPNDSNYDYEAIELIKPVSVILLYEAIGAAGGTSLHCMLKKFDNNCMGLSYHDTNIGCDQCFKFNNLNFTYRPLALSKKYSFSTSSIPSINCLLWLAAKGSKVNSSVKNELIELTRNSYSLDKDLQLLDNHNQSMKQLASIFGLIR